MLIEIQEKKFHFVPLGGHFYEGRFIDTDKIL